MKLRAMTPLDQLDAPMREDVQQFVDDFGLDRAAPLTIRPGVTTRGNIYISGSGRLVFKTYPLTERRVIERFRARWKIPDGKFGQRFGWAEWLNARAATAQCIQLAHPIAYLEQSSALSCSLQAVAFERLDDHRTCLDLMLDQQPAVQLLGVIEPLLRSLARAGVFHLDLNCRNILISPANVQGAPTCKAIDWEYACFDRRTHGRLYGYYLGYLFFGGMKRFMPEADFDTWAHRCIDDSAAEFGDDIRSVLMYYAAAKKNSFSRQDRYTLFL